MTTSTSSLREQSEPFARRARSRLEHLNQSAQEIIAELKLPPESVYAVLAAMEGSILFEAPAFPPRREPAKERTDAGSAASLPHVRRQRPTTEREIAIDEHILTAYLSKSEATTLAPGTIIQGRYEINRVIGIGGMGAVYRVRDMRFKGAVKWAALKEMILKCADHLDQQTRMRTFEREANLLALLDHPLIPRVNDFFSETNRAYLVLEYIQGKNLEEVLMETDEFLDERLVGGWALQVCEVLDYLHSFRPLPVIFRDLKPSNVILTPQNQVMLVDFGIAKVFEPDRRHTMIGTEGYSPPEQYKGQVDPRSDIYALGAMLHHLLTASDPRLEVPFTFYERPPRLLNPTISPGMEAVIMKCLAYQSDQRWQSARELSGALQHLFQPNVRSGTGQSARLLGAPLRSPVSPLQQKNPSHRGSPVASAILQPKVTQELQEVVNRAVIFGESSGATEVATPLRGIERTASRSAPTTYGPVHVALPGPTMLWSFQTEEEVRSSPTLAHNTIYAGSYDYNLYALDARTGAFKSKFATDGGICCTPACFRDLVIVGSEDHQVYAINTQANKAVWTYRTWNHVRSSPRIVQDMVVIGSDDGCVYALDVRTGRQLWKFKTWREVRSSAAHAMDLLFIGSYDAQVYAIEAVTGREKWHFTTQDRVYANPIVGEGMIYVGSMDGTLYGIDTALGWTTWKYHTSGFLLASPTLSEGRIYIGSVDRSFYCLDARTGRQIWKYQSGGQITSSAAVASGYVYFGCSDGAIYCLDAHTGQPRWFFQTGGPVPSSPLVREDVLYIGSTDHHVYALRCGF
jgi:outer membrane protein assembly factor BamB/tRNA A-37 threonylcarbamoyl transferase component Bud32